MEQIEFYREIKAHCIKEKADCTKCCLRLYCFLPPCERTDGMMEKVIAFLASERTYTDIQDDSGHYICAHPPECPCTLDMNNALGFDTLP